MVPTHMHSPVDYDLETGFELRVVASPNLAKCSIARDTVSSKVQHLDPLDPMSLAMSRACWLLVDAPYKETRIFLIRDEWIYLGSKVANTTEDHCYDASSGSGSSALLWYLIFKTCQTRQVSVLHSSGRMYRLSSIQLPTDNYEEDKIWIRGKPDVSPIDIPDILLFGSKIITVLLPIPKVYCTSLAVLESVLSISGDKRRMSRTNSEVGSEPSARPSIALPRSSRLTIGAHSLNVWRASVLTPWEAQMLIAANDTTNIFKKQIPNGILTKLESVLTKLTNKKVGLPHLTYLSGLAIYMHQEEVARDAAGGSKVGGEPVSHASRGTLSQKIQLAVASIIHPLTLGSATDLQERILSSQELPALKSRVRTYVSSIQGERVRESDFSESDLDASLTALPLKLRRHGALKIPNTLQIWTQLQTQIIAPSYTRFLINRGTRKFATIFRIMIGIFARGYTARGLFCGDMCLKDSIRREIAQVEENIQTLNMLRSSEDLLNFLFGAHLVHPLRMCQVLQRKAAKTTYIALAFDNRLYAAYFDGQRKRLVDTLKSEGVTISCRLVNGSVLVYEVNAEKADGNAAVQSRRELWRLVRHPTRLMSNDAVLHSS